MSRALLQQALDALLLWESIHSSATATKMAESKARYQQVEKDAARYRWLRVNAQPAFHTYYAGVLDAHIDAAMEKTP